MNREPPLPPGPEPDPVPHVPPNDEDTRWPPGTSELVARHWRGVYLRAYRFVRDSDVAEDLTQDTFVRFLGANAKFPAGALYKPILHRLIIDSSRKKTRHREIPLDSYQDLSRLASEAPDALTEAVVSDEYQRFRKDLEQLPEEDARLILRHHLFGEPTSEIAADLGISDGAVRVRLHRARVQLRAMRDER